MKIKIELVYDSTCPNVEKARARISKAISEIGQGLEWQEWDRADSNAPSYVKKYGSPTVLVNEMDVTGLTEGNAGDSCRIYRDKSGKMEGAPSTEAIQNAITRQQPGKIKSRNWLQVLFALPAITFAALPFLACPLCWPLYTSLLGSLGISFMNYTPYLFPLIALFLFFTLASLGYQARKQNTGYRPLILGALSALFILTGKFLLITPLLLYPGILGLLFAVGWNMRLARRQNASSCSCSTTTNKEASDEECK